MSKDIATTDQLIAYDEYNIVERLEKRLENITIRVSKEHDKYLYQRSEDEKVIVEKVIASDKLVLGILPIPPLNIPAKYVKHMMINLNTPLVINMKSSTSVYLTMPVEIGIVYFNENDTQIIDILSIGLTKYALYGLPEKGILCRYYKSRVSSRLPQQREFREAIVRVHFHNYANSIQTINKIVFPIEYADLYYKNGEAYFDDVDVVIKEGVQNMAEVSVKSAEWSAKKTNLNKGKKFDNVYTMEWGF